MKPCELWRNSGRYVRKVIDMYETVRVMAELGQICEEGHRYMWNPASYGEGHRYSRTLRVMGKVIYVEPCELWRNSGSYVRKVIDIYETLRVMEIVIDSRASWESDCWNPIS